MNKQCAAWSRKNNVEVQADFITSMGNKNRLTIAAEAQAKAGHDIQQLPSWEVPNQADLLTPMDEVMKALTAKYGGVSRVAEYLSKIKGHWVAVPFSSGSQYKGPCARISVMKQLAGIDVVKMYPLEEVYTPEADAWMWDNFLKPAEACDKNPDKTSRRPTLGPRTRSRDSYCE